MLARYQLAAEFVGTAFLLIAMVGTTAMASRLFGDNGGLILLSVSLATGATLYIMIAILAPLSGAHFNPAVTLAFRLRDEITTGTAIRYVAAQIAGGIVGVWLAHLMFALPVLQASTTVRTGVGQWLGEMIATFGLVLLILVALRTRPAAIAALVGSYIAAAHWFASSSSFANPAVSIARALTDTAAGIHPLSVPVFLVVQLVAAFLAVQAAAFLVDSHEGADG